MLKCTSRVTATTTQAIILSTARAFTFGGSGGIRSSNSSSTILRGSKEIRTALHLSDDNAFREGIQKSTGIGRKYGGYSKSADGGSAETRAGINDSAGSGGVKAQRRAGSARAARRSMERGAEGNAGTLQTMVEMMRTSGEMSSKAKPSAGLNVKLVPLGENDGDIEAYLVTFERIMAAHKVDKNRW